MQIVKTSLHHTDFNKYKINNKLNSINNIPHSMERALVKSQVSYRKINMEESL